MKITQMAKNIARATADDAYSFDAYGRTEWEKCAQLLLGHGFKEPEVSAILRSKYTRWSADEENASRGYATAAGLRKFMIKWPKLFTAAAIKKMIRETE